MQKNNNYINNDKIVLGLLTTVDNDNNITQRSISSKLGIALGLTNSYLRKCIDKGLVKIKHVPKNRYAYYLTPRGFIEKARITQEYLHASFTYVRKIKVEFTNIFNQFEAKGGKNIILSDITEIAEIAILSSLGTKSKVIGVIGKEKNHLYNVSVYEQMSDSDNIDYVIVTADHEIKKRHDFLIKTYGKTKVILPSMLNELLLGSKKV
ncbi:winged helix-turn-helix transcriptional regulator [Alphaproteobacteria bacterium]|nr:winged helix-turn-helix transcriptional regulator [Alphaproteobacteria bacterium]